MKKWVIVIVTLLFLCTSTPGITAQAGGKGEKGPSERAYERANEKASFKREEGSTQKQGKKPKKEKVGKDVVEETSAETKGNKGQNKEKKAKKKKAKVRGRTNPDLTAHSGQFWCRDGISKRNGCVNRQPCIRAIFGKSVLTLEKRPPYLLYNERFH